MFDQFLSQLILGHCYRQGMGRPGFKQSLETWLKRPRIKEKTWNTATPEGFLQNCPDKNVIRLARKEEGKGDDYPKFNVSFGFHRGD